MICNRVKYLFLFAVISFSISVKANDETQTRIAVLFSDYTAKLDEEFIPKVNNQITLWEIFLMQNKIPYSVIYDKDLEHNISDDYDILILPSVYSISERELNSLRQFLDNGKSILNMGSKLNYDEDQNYKGMNNLNKLFGVYFFEYKEKDLSLFQYLDQESIISDDNFKNPFIQISTKYPPIICNIESNNYKNIGYLKTVKENPLQTLITYGKSNKGKFVNFGFNLDDMIGSSSEQEIFNSLILNSLTWLDNTPDIYVKNYPNEYTTATIVLIQNNSGLEPGMIDNLKKNDIEPYLVITPDQVLDDDISTKINDDHFIVDLRNFIIDNSDTLDNLFAQITAKENLFNNKISAVLLSEQMMQNDHFISSLNKNGINIFLLNQYSPGYPDYLNNKNFIVPYFENDKEDIQPNGIKIFTFKSKFDCNENYAKNFVDNILKSQSYKNWFCSLNQLKDWYEIKSNVNVSISKIIENKLTITISNNNADQVDGINLLINLPAGINSELLKVDSGNNLVDYSVDDLNQLHLIINDLEPRQLKKINISFYVK